MFTRRALAALSVAALSLLAACGGGTGGGPGQDPSVEASADDDHNPAVNLQDLVSSSVSKAAGVTTSRFAMSMTMPGPEGTPMTIEGSGVQDTAIPALSMSMDMGAMGLGQEGTVDARMVGQTLYYKFPAAFGLPSGKPWLKMDFEALSKLSGFDLGGLMDQFEQSDPKANLGMLAGATDVTEVGREEVRGHDTRHLKMTVDMKEAVADAPASVRESVAKMADMLGSSRFPAEVWIGDDELPYRMTTTMTFAGEGPVSGSVQMSMDFFDYGVDVDVDAPPAGQTMDFMEFMGRMAGMGASNS